jgi:hypothetical protein
MVSWAAKRAVCSARHASSPVWTLSLSQHQLAVSIPQMVVLSTELFDEFMERNGLYELAFDELEDERIAAAFQDADFPMEFVGDLRGLVEDVREPLAVRSSSLLEDRMVGPFAGVYGTKMVPNDQPDSASRFAKLIEAIKFIYASVFFREPRDYFRALGEDPRREKMAVLLQRIVGQRHGERFYPHVSGVARSFNYYPFGEAKRRDGVVHLALGLGKWVVDGESTWMFSPEQPRSGPPFNGPDDMMKRSQLEFWAVRMGKRADFDPLSEDEYLERYSLFEADYDATLDQIASTFDADLGRLIPGVSRKGRGSSTLLRSFSTSACRSSRSCGSCWRPARVTTAPTSRSSSPSCWATEDPPASSFCRCELRPPSARPRRSPRRSSKATTS